MMPASFLFMLFVMSTPSVSKADGCGFALSLACQVDAAGATPRAPDPVTDPEPQRPAAALDPYPAGIDARPKPAKGPQANQPGATQENTYDLGGQNGGNRGKLPGAGDGEPDVSLLRGEKGVATPAVDFVFRGGAASAR